MTPSQRYIKLEQHLSQENPVLLDVIQIYRELDKIGYKTGLLQKNQSYAELISWWPLISILGTFSAGKSSFINHYLQTSIQTSGNQAVDDKFTVICYSDQENATTLPGLALDSDPRFPFYGISREIEAVEAGQGDKIDQYLQLKTVHSDRIRDKIMIDSPGFDADCQRDSTLKITHHIMDISDLVLVFFDARHPEPGAMRDTLNHLVESVIERKDFGKVLYILNQIDTAAKEDNPEEVISSWQRALSSKGLIGGNFFTIYNESLANFESHPEVEERFKRKKETDIQKIYERMDKVSIERSYRIAHMIETIAKEIQAKKLPELQIYLEKWRRNVLIVDILALTAISIILFNGIDLFGGFESSTSEWGLTQALKNSATYSLIFAALILGTWLGIHGFIRQKLGEFTLKKIQDPQLANAFRHNTRFWRSLFIKPLRGWSQRTQKGLHKIMESGQQAIQKLNDQFANPSAKTTSEHELDKHKQ